MTTTTETRLLTGSLLRVLAANFGALTSLYLLLATVPLYIGAGGSGAVGLATGALMVSCMVTEVMTPRLIARYGYRSVLALGLALLGLPALALPLVSGVSLVVVLCVLCGLGFGIIVVVAGALVALLVPPARRGEGLGLVGVVVSLPGVLGLPVGVWLAGSAGCSVVFLLAGAAALSGLAVVPWIPAVGASGSSVGVLAGLRSPALVRPSLVFFATTSAAGIAAAFLPLAVGNASLALLVQTVTTTFARLFAGRYGDRHGAHRLMLLGLLACALGIFLVVFSPVVAMLVFGAGFGVVQNASLSVMLQRVPKSEYGTVSAVWNVSYDSGWGLGAEAFGVLAGVTVYGAAFVVTAGLMLVALRAVDGR